MTFFRWTDELALGIDVIDRQHRRLVDLIRSLHEDILDKRHTRESTAEVLEELFLYAAIHFREEERLMEECGYPDIDNHRQEHVFFLNKIKDLDMKFRSGSVTVNMELMDFMKTWLQYHIKVTDRRYLTCMNRQNPSKDVDNQKS